MPDKPLVYTATCTNGYADVSLFVHDGQFDPNGDRCESAPSYCRVNAKDKNGKPN